MSKQVYLDYHSTPHVVSDDAYGQIQAIISTDSVCEACERFYSEQNPMVALNLCLACFLKKEANYGLRYIGKKEEGTYSTYFQFIDPQGYVYYSYTTGLKAERSIYQTIRYWGFNPPNSHLVKGKGEIHLDETSWSIYGDFTRNSVVILKYKQSYGNQHEAFFFAYQKGRSIEINKRKKEVQHLFAQARAQLEATKDASGKFFYGTGEHDYTYHIEEHHVLRIVARLASQEYDRT